MNEAGNIFPSEHNPYYIVCHPYTRVSAGIKCLHLLCHNLNLKGFPAYLIFLGDQNLQLRDDTTGIDFITPILTQRIARAHFEIGRTPIMVYPEIVAGNPFDSPCVVRYVLNFPGLLGGDTSYPETDLCFGYSKVLANTTNTPDNILFIPASDTRTFYPPENTTPRKGTCFYASKYQREHNGKLFDLTKDSVEITSRLETSQSPQEIAELFRKSELFYTYENTALAIESTLCGCPAVFLPNPHLESVIAIEELGRDGIAWGTEPWEILRAKQTVDNAAKNYFTAVEKFKESLEDFIKKTQEHSKKKVYANINFLNLCSHLVPEAVLTPNYAELTEKERNYAKSLKKLPWKIEQQIGALLCSLGLMHDGQFLWNRASRRSRNN